MDKTELEIQVIQVTPSLDHGMSLNEVCLPPMVAALVSHEYTAQIILGRRISCTGVFSQRMGCRASRLVRSLLFLYRHLERNHSHRSYPFSYGVFLEHYKTHVFPDAPSFVLALVGSMSTGIIYLASWMILPLIARYPGLKKSIMAVGVVLCVTGLIGAAFATQPWQLVLTQGVIYALGGST